MKLNKLMDYVGHLGFSAKQIEQAENRLDSLYLDKGIAQRESEVPGNSEYVESDTYFDNLIKEQEKILESNTIEKIFEKESLSEEEIEILYHFREDLSKIENDYVYILSCEDRDLANPTYEAVLFAKHIGSHPALKDVDLTKELAKEICDAGEYICKEYVYCNYDEDVVYRKNEIADVMDELLSICPNLKKVIENQKVCLQEKTKASGLDVLIQDAKRVKQEKSEQIEVYCQQYEHQLNDNEWQMFDGEVCEEMHISLEEKIASAKELQKEAKAGKEDVKALKEAGMLR